MDSNLKIFLSSTKVDLSEVRQNIIKFLGVLKSDLIAMEIFGSDETKPVDYSLSQVRKCNLFIGIYAERYGQIDPQTGKSITELEYIEANKMLQKNQLKGLLLYIIDKNAKWHLNLIERESNKVEKLADFKENMRTNHTVSSFQNVADLPFLVLRDVIRKISIGSDRLFKAKERKIAKQRTSLERPIGMEYYGEDLARLFFGRDNELNVLEDQILKYKMSLLIGSSGVGKTSLLCAGLLNRLKEIGWQTALVRPLTDPDKNLKRFLWDQLLQGDLPVEFDLSSVINAASTAYIDKQILVVIDQFEDILAAKEPSDIEVITKNLLNIFRSASENLRILICYRGDIEPHIGTIWQKISGSPQGLPRTYLGPLAKQNAKLAFESTLSALGLTVKETGKDPSTFINKVLADLETESFLSGYMGIYPPFMQMIISRIYEDKDKQESYHANKYYSSGQSKRIIADYLMNQLKYLANKIDVGKAILIALVSSYGTKTQKTLEEISKESLLPSADVETTLYSLIDLRLVRSVNGTYEIAHDFLAKIITTELVSIEEREAKKFKDLLASRTAAYESTKAGLTRSEHLHIYKFRNKILCTEDEVRLLLESYLSGNGPISYWSTRYPKRKLISWTRQLISEQRAEIEEAAYRFLIKLGEKPTLPSLAEAFSDYKKQHQLSRYISDFATNNDIELLIKLNKNKAEEVANASQEALVRLIKLNDETLLEKMAKSNSEKTNLTFEKVALNLSKDLPLEKIRAGLCSKELWRRVFSTYALANKGTKVDLANLQKSLKDRIPQKMKTATIKTITRLAIRLGNLTVLKKQISNKNQNIVEETLEAIDAPCKIIKINDLFTLYKKHPFLVSKAIYNISTPADVPELRRILSEISLDPPARELLYALCKFGKQKNFSFLLELFLNYEEEINFWNPFAVVGRVSNLATKKHLALLEKVINTKEFWRYYSEGNRPESRMPLKNYCNAYFIKRMAGTAFGKVASRANFPVIYKMLRHDYWIIRNAALEAIRKHGKKSDLGQLLEIAIEEPSKSEGLIEAICIIDDKIGSER